MDAFVELPGAIRFSLDGLLESHQVYIYQLCEKNSFLVVIALCCNRKIRSSSSSQGSWVSYDLEQETFTMLHLTQ